MKRIIVCLDGTWNDAARGRPPTNVVRIRNAVASRASDHVTQRVYYDEGVGTDDPVNRLTGGVLGAGLSLNVRQAYKYLARHYKPGDEIFLIGFSRGAFTARSVAGFIAACGLLTSENCTGLNEERAWRHYRLPSKDRPIGDEMRLKALCHPDVPIQCVAVFDTVGTLGIPNTALNWIGRGRFAFHDTRLGSAVRHALHAVALDEKRNAFKATMWEAPFNPTGPLPEVSQVWFPGVHADVGGGYQDGDLAGIPLDWMMRRLEALGVSFKMPMADQPAGNGLDPLAPMHESRSLPLYLPDRFGPHDRPVVGVAASEQSQRSRPQMVYDPIAEGVHRSVLERWSRDPAYRPRNLDYVMFEAGGEKLPVIDWDGSPMTPEAVAEAFPFVAEAERLATEP